MPYTCSECGIEALEAWHDPDDTWIWCDRCFVEEKLARMRDLDLPTPEELLEKRPTGGQP